VQVVAIRDAIGNETRYSTTDLAALGFPTSLTVASVHDETAPVLTAFSFAPAAIDVSTSPAVVTVDFSATDDLSGVIGVAMDFRSPSGTLRSGSASTPAALSTSGSFPVDFPAFDEPGVWLVQVVAVRDAVGNEVRYSTSDLAALGFATTLIVGGGVPHTLYLHGVGGTANPPILSIGTDAATGSTPKYKDSPAVKFAGGNAWKQVGTWDSQPSLIGGQLQALSDAHLWLGLRNSDDIGTRFDVRVEVLKNGALVSSGETLCVNGVTRNPALAKEVTIGFGAFDAVSFDGASDLLSFRVLARIGTNGSGGFCGGHANATGLRTYFDSTGRLARFVAEY
jgi:hypothetical protein